MIRLFITCFASFLAIAHAFAQATRITVKITAPVGYTGNIGISDQYEQYDPLKKDNSIVLNTQQTGTRELQTNPAHYVQLSFGFLPRGSKRTLYQLFISPGDDVTFTIDLDKKDNGIMVSGKGSNNNQPEIAPLTDIYATMATRDTSAYHAIEIINKQQKLNEKVLEDYITKYKPSADFIKNSRINLAYYPAVSFYMLKTNSLDYSRNFGPWQHFQDSLFANIKVNNDEALTAYNYRAFASELLLRLKEKAWTEARTNPVAFYKKWYDSDITEGKPLFTNQRKNLFIEKVLNKNFTGKTAEFLYADLLMQNLGGSNIENIGLIFEHFKQLYPASKYIAWFSGSIDDITKKQASLNNKIIFMADNGRGLNSFKDVLALAKGKTVLVDMWGTWCGPCRQDIERYSAGLHNYYKDKDVTFFYIANIDEDHEQGWKRLIAYLDLEGTHILANKKLTADIMGKVKRSAYPTYILIKKDGTFALTKAQRLQDGALVIKEIDDAIALKN